MALSYLSRTFRVAFRDSIVLRPTKDSNATAFAVPYALSLAWACSLFSFTNQLRDAATSGMRAIVIKLT